MGETGRGGGSVTVSYTQKKSMMNKTCLLDCKVKQVELSLIKVLKIAVNYIKCKHRIHYGIHA